jgi:hypothetical protein
VLIKIGFILNKLYILGVTLREQCFKNFQRSIKAGNKDLFLIIIFSNLIVTLKYKQTTLILYKKASILRRII